MGGYDLSKAAMLAGAAMLVATPISAAAQDVIVMRRPIAPPNKAQVKPTPTPTATTSPTPETKPTPTPTPTPVTEPTPTPTPGPSVSGYRIATLATPKGGQVLGASAVQFEFEGVRCVTEDGSPSTADCTGQPARGKVGTAAVAATISTNLRAAFVKPADISDMGPGVLRPDAYCNTSLGVQADGASQTYRLVCVAEDVREHYQRYATTATTNQIATGATTYSVGTLGGLRCLDTDTGADAAVQSRCDGFPMPTATTNVPARTNAASKIVAIDGAALKAAFPAMTNYDALCAGTTPVTNAGKTETWQLRCTLDEANDRYSRVAKVLSDPFAYYSSSARRFMNTDTLAQSLVTSISDTSCQDSAAGGAAVAAANCANLQTGANVYDLVTLPAQFNADLRAVYLPRTTFAQAAPGAAASDLDSMCNSSIRVGTSAGTVPYIVRCDPKAVQNTYERYAHFLADPFDYYATSAKRFSNPDPSTSVILSVGATGCWDNSTGKIAASSSPCTNLQTGANVYDLITVPAVVRTDLRTFSIDKAALLSRVSHYDANTGSGINTLCASTIRVGTSAGTTVWKLRCDPAETSGSYARYSQSFLDPWNYGTSAQGTLNNSPSATALKFVTTATRCWDDTNNRYATDQTKCDWLPTGANTYDVLTIPAAFRQDLRTVIINPTDMDAASPHAVTGSVANGGGGANSAYWCSGSQTFGIVVNGARQTWKLRCNASEIAGDYSRYSRSFLDPYSYGTSAQSTLNSSATASTLKLVTMETKCWDDTNNRYATDQTKCDWLPTGANMYDVLTIPASFRQDLRTLIINPTDIDAASPHAVTSSVANGGGGNNSTYWCSGSQAMYIVVNGTRQTWKVRCNAADIQGDYSRYSQSFLDPYSYGTSAQSTLNNSATASTLKMVTVATKCWDDTNNRYAVDQTKCDWLQTGANLYDVLTIPATFRQDLRTLVINPADIDAASPHAVTSATASGGGGNNSTYWCSGSQSYYIVVNGTRQTWKVRCNAADIQGDYSRYAQSFLDPYNYGTSAQSTLNNSATASTLKMVVTATKCWDDTNNRYATDQSKCDWLPSGANTYDVLTLPAQFNPSLRTIAISAADMNAASPHAVGTSTATGGGGNNSTYWCNSSQTMYIVVNGTRQTWTVSCNADDVVDHYERATSSLVDPTTANGAYQNLSTSDVLKMTVNVTVCWDTRANAVSATDRCTYLPTGSNVNDVLSIPAAYNATAKTITLRKTDITAIAPRMTAAQVNSTCSRTVRVGTSSSTAVTYQVGCQ